MNLPYKGKLTKTVLKFSFSEVPHCQFSEFFFTFIFWKLKSQNKSMVKTMLKKFVKWQNSRSVCCDFTEKFELHNIWQEKWQGTEWTKILRTDSSDSPKRKQAHVYSEGAKYCDLCLTEKNIIMLADKNGINIQSEILRKCPHIRKFTLGIIKPPSSVSDNRGVITFFFVRVICSE